MEGTSQSMDTGGNEVQLRNLAPHPSGSSSQVMSSSPWALISLPALLKKASRGRLQWQAGDTLSQLSDHSLEKSRPGISPRAGFLFFENR